MENTPPIQPFLPSGGLAVRLARAGEGIRTLDINLGKVALYQLSYARDEEKLSSARGAESTLFPGMNLHPIPHPIRRCLMNPDSRSAGFLQRLFHRLPRQLRPVAVLADVPKKKLP